MTGYFFIIIIRCYVSRPYALQKTFTRSRKFINNDGMSQERVLCLILFICIMNEVIKGDHNKEQSMVGYFFLEGNALMHMCLV